MATNRGDHSRGEDSHDDVGTANALQRHARHKHGSQKGISKKF